MQRIDGNGRAPAIPNPPASPADANNHCVACHVVSRDGRYLAGELWGGGDKGAVFDLSDPAVTAGNPAPTLAPVTASSYTSLFSTFNPDGSRLLINPGTQARARRSARRCDRRHARHAAADRERGASVVVAGRHVDRVHQQHHARRRRRAVGRRLRSWRSRGHPGDRARHVRRAGLDWSPRRGRSRRSPRRRGRRSRPTRSRSPTARGTNSRGRKRSTTPRSAFRARCSWSRATAGRRSGSTRPAAARAMLPAELQPV